MEKQKHQSEAKKIDERKSSFYSFTVDSFADGIAFGQHRLPPGQDMRNVYALHLRDDLEVIQLRSRYSLSPDNPLHQLEKHLMRLSGQGILERSIIHLGVTTDPFHPFEGKFDGSMKFLELFKKYTPGLLVVQTRSPLIVVAMPVLRRLGNKCIVTLGIETPSEEAAARYTPGLPRVAERLKTARALRNFGIKVNIQVAPVLPYGDWKADAGSFGAMLAEHADGIHIKPLTDGSERVERKIRATALAQKLAQDRKFHWLRPDSARPLYDAIERIAPEKLVGLDLSRFSEKQLGMFAA